MIDIRGGILAVTICLVILVLANRDAPVKQVRNDYCKVGNQFWPCKGLKYRLNI